MAFEIRTSNFKLPRNSGTEESLLYRMSRFTLSGELLMKSMDETMSEFRLFRPLLVKSMLLSCSMSGILSPL